jgi:hypothetical protein
VLTKPPLPARMSTWVGLCSSARWGARGASGLARPARPPLCPGQAGLRLQQAQASPCIPLALPAVPRSASHGSCPSPSLAAPFPVALRQEGGREGKQRRCGSSFAFWHQQVRRRGAVRPALALLGRRLVRRAGGTGPHLGTRRNLAQLTAACPASQLILTARP